MLIIILGIEIILVGLLMVKEIGFYLYIEGLNFLINFDKVKGVLMNVIWDGKKLLYKGLKFIFWWVLISNDMEIIDEMKKKYFLYLEYEIVCFFEWKKVDDFI